MDLSKMSRDELTKLRTDVDKALADFDNRRRAEARAAAEKVAREHGFALDDLTGNTDKKSGRKSPAKYRNPEDPRQTWTGRGRQPGWIKAALADGRPLSDFTI
ncbi:histone-like nucleoid-structuring protein H-NS [Oceaniovalibus guishaninsula JLT2003]|uniref:Histone-like nucleoid-structuring protein H-NS n=1 Tax=Oceaniovalibus guishaninsula JLT2003 TaxID=1231392 RepID=K2HGL9_9RHOB|nr:H-NS histone family protein [Oceaniovalibus guishaninsula]EKE45582.1 histone-like nucleoid-structuring protein H-NS [Oceaniovalibus guishaninsula JLT2003]